MKLANTIFADRVFVGRLRTIEDLFLGHPANTLLEPTSRLRNWMRWLTERPQPVLWLRALFLLVCSAWLDVATGVQVSVFAFYFVPLFVAAFLISARAGIIISVLAAVIRLYANFLLPNYLTDASIGLFLVPTWNFLVDLISFLIFNFLFASVREQLARENLLARRDPLTKAYNLRAFTEAVQGEISRIHRHSTPFTLVYMDLDNFKAVNDSLGHEAGDELLQTVVKTLQCELRSLDVVARLGGDEFAILMPQSNGAGGAIALQRMQEFLLQAMAAHQWPVTFSMGGVTFNTAPLDFEDATRQADKLMYQAKKSGKNQYLHEIRGIDAGEVPSEEEDISTRPLRAKSAGKFLV